MKRLLMASAFFVSVCLLALSFWLLINPAPHWRPLVRPIAAGARRCSAASIALKSPDVTVRTGLAAP